MNVSLHTIGCGGTGRFTEWRQTAVMFVVGTALVLSCPSKASAGHIRFDFETGPDGWTVVSGTFGRLYSDRPTFFNSTDSYNRHGRCHLTTLETDAGSPDDSFMGVIVSPVFVPEGPDMSFLVGGGNHDGSGISLVTLDGAVLAYARGTNTETMRRVEWHLPTAVGSQVYIAVTDSTTGGWGHVTFDDFRAEGVIDSGVSDALVTRFRLEERRTALIDRLNSCGIDALDSAIRNLSKKYGVSYPHGKDFHKRLTVIEKATGDARKAVTADAVALVDSVFEAAEALRYDALTANPQLRGRQILFVVRPQYLPDHHNTATIFQTGEVNTLSFRGGSALKVLTLDPTPAVRTILDVPEGIVRDPDVHFSGDRILCSIRWNIGDDYHIYEMNVDGSGLRQLTSAGGVSDIDPSYMPDGSIVFSSTREPKYCMCNRHIMANLYRMEADGANIRQIGKSTLFEGHPTVMPDGRILYDRWEYVDRNFGDAQGLWTANPDGTMHALFWGNNTPSPGGIIDARALAEPGRAICIFGSCHDRPWGALALIDRRLGTDGRIPVVRTWPANAVDLVGKGGWDTFMPVRPRYEDPYPLDDDTFLCARTVGDREETGVFLVDTFGNEVLLHAEQPGCFDPITIAPKDIPPVIPDRVNLASTEGKFYAVDVYEGTHMTGVERGSAKYLRIIESPEKRSWNYFPWSGQGTLWPAMNWHDFCNKRILGTVPVEDDGSAYFTVPAETFVYFQLLDGNGMMIQSMRSGTSVQPGEVTGCIGCHESRTSAPPVPVSKMPLACERDPSVPDSWFGEPRLFSYRREIQPIFTDNCARCHDFGTPAGKRLVLADDATLVFNAAYMDLWCKGLTGSIGAGPTEIQQPYSWGSHASRLIEVVRGHHKGVVLEGESLARLITWVDINAPYYPVYETAYPDNLAGRAPLPFDRLDRLVELTGVNFRSIADFQRSLGPQVSFSRPELSPCLAALDSTTANYAEALAIIREGAAYLATTPRADMPGFVPCLIDQLRNGKYVLRRQEEHRIRDAIETGVRVYDDGLGYGGTP